MACAKAVLGAATAAVRAQRNCRRSLSMECLPCVWSDYNGFPVSEIRARNAIRMQQACKVSRHVADCLDLEAAVQRRAAGLHAGARRQRLGATEVAAVDAVELFLLALVLEPDDHL